MTAKQVLNAVAALPYEDWVEIQTGIADLMAAQFTASEVSEIRQALEEGEAEIDRGEGLTPEQMRKALGHS